MKLCKRDNFTEHCVFKRIVLLAITIGLPFFSCNTDSIVVEGDASVSSANDNGGHGIVRLAVNVPKGSISTYVGEDATVDENHIDTLFIKIYEDGNFLTTKKIYGSDLQKVINTNDSIVNVDFEIDNLTGGVVSAEAFANRMELVPITDEIALPNPSIPKTQFMMSGRGALTHNGNAYSGTIHIVRNVSKLRIRVSKADGCLPSDLVINYNDISVEALQVPDRTQLFPPLPITTPASLTYINYTDRSGADLRPEGPIATFNGGQLDSLYLNENYLEEASYNDANKTKIKLVIPMQSPGEPEKKSEYTYTLYSEGGYQIKRNYIYTLDIKILGNSLDPLVTMSVLPWNDIDVDGNINGVKLNLDKETVEITSKNLKTNPQNVVYETDNTSVTLDWSGIDPAHNIDTSTIYIQGRTGPIHIFWTGDGAPEESFVDTLLIISQNVVKKLPIVYDAPKGSIGEWVGAFYRWDQTGERIIKMRNKGLWTATVTVGADFIVLDGTSTTDPNWGTFSAALGNDPGFDAAYPVNNTATTVSGIGLIYLRVGLTSKLSNVSSEPRYGVIEIVTNKGTKKLYVRQGEEPDYVMRPEDANPSDGGNTRSYAVKFSPFNLTDPAKGTGGNDISNHSDMPYGDIVFNENKFTEYPTQAGCFFQWNLGGNEIHKAYNPINPSGQITNFPTVTKLWWDKSKDPCPAGYRHPNDSLKNVQNSELRQSWYAVPNNNVFHAFHPESEPLSNSLWGFYADGLFDRMEVTTSITGEERSTVCFNSSNLADPINTGVAYCGRLIYNPNNNASLFLPAAGIRDRSLFGKILLAGTRGYYWSSTIETAYGSAYAFYFNNSTFYSYDWAGQMNAENVRCVRADFGLPGSPDYTSPSVSSGEGPSGGVVLTNVLKQ